MLTLLNQMTKKEAQHTGEPMKKTINITELAQRLGVTRQTIHNMLKENRIPITQIKGFKTPRWAAGDIEKWIASEEKA